jgi:hypothetical protein
MYVGGDPVNFWDPFGWEKQMQEDFDALSDAVDRIQMTVIGANPFDQGTGAGDWLRSNIPLLGSVFGFVVDLTVGVGGAVYHLASGDGREALKSLGTAVHAVSHIADSFIPSQRARECVNGGLATLGWGVVGKVWTTAKDTLNVLTLGRIAAFGQRDSISGKMVSTGFLNAVVGLAADATFPTFGMYNGKGWGDRQFGSDTFFGVNGSDHAGFQHDIDGDEGAFANAQVDAIMSGDAQGIYGIAMAGIGAAAFGAAAYFGADLPKSASWRDSQWAIDNRSRDVPQR